MLEKRVQVQKEHYDIGKYADPVRFTSYFYQVDSALKNVKNGNILVIGKGDGIVPAILNYFLKDRVKTFDFDASLLPDYVGDLSEIGKTVTDKFDVVICCQVLEHIPYNHFDDILRQIKHICSGTFILSLPYRRINFTLTIDMPMFRHKTLNMDIPCFY